MKSIGIDSTFYSYKLNELPLKKVSERLKKYQAILSSELKAKGIPFTPHLWVSDEWFCPDGVPGFALPFYLFHSDLMKIEKREMGFVEGSTENQILKLMRHELGHAIDNAYRLRKNKERQQIFGSSEKDYPKFYQPKKYSQNFVDYLGDNYAQSHPDEDFAETFALWLDPKANGFEKYKLKPAMKKLLFMDELMGSLKGKKPELKNQFRVTPIESLKVSLKAHYKNKKRDFGHNKLKTIDENLLKISSPDKGRGTLPLSLFLQQERRNICREVANKNQAYLYQVNYVINKTIVRANKLQVVATKAELKRQSPRLIEKSFRYLKERDELKFYL